MSAKSSEGGGAGARGADEVAEKAISLRLFSESLRNEHSLGAYLVNGGRTGDIVWGQSREEVHVFWRVPERLTSKQIRCTFHRDRIRIVRDAVEGESTGEIIVADETLSRCASASDCTWEIEVRVLRVSLYKEVADDKDVWWRCPFTGGQEIDVLVAKGEQQAPIVPGGADEHRARVQMQQDQDRMRESQLRAMEDPKKRSLLEMMRQKFPDVPVEFK